MINLNTPSDTGYSEEFETFTPEQVINIGNEDIEFFDTVNNIENDLKTVDDGIEYIESNEAFAAIQKEALYKNTVNASVARAGVENYKQLCAMFGEETSGMPSLESIESDPVMVLRASLESVEETAKKLLARIQRFIQMIIRKTKDLIIKAMLYFNNTESKARALLSKINSLKGNPSMFSETQRTEIAKRLPLMTIFTNGVIKNMTYETGVLIAAINKAVSDSSNAMDLKKLMKTGNDKKSFVVDYLKKEDEKNVDKHAKYVESFERLTKEKAFENKPSQSFEEMMKNTNRVISIFRFDSVLFVVIHTTEYGDKVTNVETFSSSVSADWAKKAGKNFSTGAEKDDLKNLVGTIESESKNLKSNVKKLIDAKTASIKDVINDISNKPDSDELVAANRLISMVNKRMMSTITTSTSILKDGLWFANESVKTYKDNKNKDDKNKDDENKDEK